MATYRSKVIASTWTSFKNGALSAQGKSLAAGVSVVGQEAGDSSTGDTVIQFGNLYSKLKWFDVVPDAPPPPDPDPEPAALPVELRGFDAEGNPVSGAVWRLE